MAVMPLPRRPRRWHQLQHPPPRPRRRPRRFSPGSDVSGQGEARAQGPRQARRREAAWRPRNRPAATEARPLRPRPGDQRGLLQRLQPPRRLRRPRRPPHEPPGPPAPARSAHPGPTASPAGLPRGRDERRRRRSRRAHGSQPAGSLRTRCRRGLGASTGHRSGTGRRHRYQALARIVPRRITSAPPGTPLSSAGMRRVNVIGTSGSGKTTVAAALADRLGIRHVELDALSWVRTGRASRRRSSARGSPTPPPRTRGSSMATTAPSATSSGSAPTRSSGSICRDRSSCGA